MRNLILRGAASFAAELAFARTGNGLAPARCGSEGRARPDGGLPDGLRFLMAWLRNPAGTAAVAPSSRALAERMTQDIDGQAGPVLELGPGTGVFTQSLLAHGVAENDLTLVEQNPDFVQLLSDRFPKARVLPIDAAALDRFRTVEDRPFGAVICGLGLRNMDAALVEAIVGASFRQLRRGGAFYLFTYGLRCSVPDEVLERLGLIAERMGTTLRNVPPATIYRITARATDECGVRS